MLYMKNWSIRTRVLLAFFAILVPFLGFTGIAALHYGTLMHSFVRTQETETGGLKRTSEIMAAADGLISAIEEQLAGKGRQAQRRVQSQLMHLHESFKALETISMEGAEERQLIGVLRDLMPRLEAFGRELAATPSPAARDVSGRVGALIRLHDQVDTAVHRLMEIHVRKIDAAILGVSDVSQQVIFVTIVTLIISGVMAVGISIPLAHWLSRPIVALAQGSRRLAEGDLSHRVEVASGGELGETAQAFNVMAERLERSAIENAALYGAVRQRADRIAAINRLTRIVSASLDIGAVYETFAAELKRLIPYTRMGIVIVEDSGRRLRLFQLVGDRLDTVPIGAVWSGGEGTGVEWVMSHKRPHVEADLAKRGQFIEDGMLVNEGIRSTVRLPLMVAGQVVGVLFLDDVAPDRYAQSDLKLLIPLAEQLAIAIEHARLHGELEQRVAERTLALRQTQAQLIQSGKLAAVGTLAAGVAHELNQPLMIIRGYAQELLKDRRIADHEIREDLQRIEAQTTRMVAIITRLRDFSRESKGHRRVTDLNQLVRDTLTFLSRQLKTRDITVLQELDPALPSVWTDPLQIEQVLLNLLTNAGDAMETEGRGVITIRTELAPNNRVALSVTDTGPGIPADVQPRIFDPFFTTKEVGKGTGLGLSICHGIVEEHGGHLTVESPVVDGRGTRLTMSLPCARPDDRKGEPT